MASSEPTPTIKQDYRNSDLVSRLLAATPPYLYNMPLVPNSFFFSEMLRSFVQAKSNPVPPHMGSRRGRKRTWREAKPLPNVNEKPLELTTTKVSTPPPKPVSPSVPQPLPPPIPPPPLLLPPCNLLPLPSPSTEPLLPPTAPLWYPPIYPPQPPYSFDPLHFFIDLRVSGHIWDRKQENKGELPSPSSMEPLNLQTDDKKDMLRIGSPFRQNKHNSAFSVPQPRETNAEPAASSDCSKKSTHGTNYVLQNLSRIYQDVKNSQDSKSDEELTAEEKKCKDLRALIGLELVVDYVKHEDHPGAKNNEPDDELEISKHNTSFMSSAVSQELVTEK